MLAARAFFPRRLWAKLGTDGFLEQASVKPSALPLQRFFVLSFASFLPRSPGSHRRRHHGLRLK